MLGAPKTTIVRDLLRLTALRAPPTFRARRGAYVSLVLLIGLVGGVAMAAVEGARRTQSSFSTYLASTNPSDLKVVTAFDRLTANGYLPSLDRAISHLPHVKQAAEVIGFDGMVQVLQQLHGNGPPGESPPALEGGLGGEFVSQDTLSLVHGRRADPGNEDEVVMSAGSAADMGLHIGSTVRLAFFTNAQENSAGFKGYPTDRPFLITRLKLVGIVESSSQVVEDDDAALHNQFIVMTPALTRRLATCCAAYTRLALQVEDGERGTSTVLAGITRMELKALGASPTRISPLSNRGNQRKRQLRYWPKPNGQSARKRSPSAFSACSPSLPRC